MAQKSELESFLHEANEYLEPEFGLEKPKADINLCSKYEWMNLKEVSGPAFYHPREGKVYLSPDASIADFAHEYFGHALYSEQSSLGKKLKNYLKSIAEIEDKYNIPKDANLSIKHSNKFKIEKIKENEHILFCDTQNPKIQKYIQLKKEAKDFFDKLQPIQEGFSAWMEEKILKQLGFTDLWEQRRQLLAKSPYFSFYNLFLKEEAEKGTITLLYKFGFPKSKDRNILKKVAKENLKSFDGLKYLIQYGSLERDIDLVAVYSDKAIQKTGLIYDGCIDINILDESSFLQKLSLYDIEFLEPIFTGSLLVGDEKSFEKMKSEMRQGKPSDDAVEYANKRSLETFNSALFFYHQNKFKCNESLFVSSSSNKIAKIILEEEILDFCSESLLYTLNNLSFSLSYKLSAEHYIKRKSFTTFKTLMKNSLLKELIRYIKDVENGVVELKEDVTLEFIAKTKDFLLDSFHP